ncbi:unnamed protein product [Fraxinus pennsylvanica]|uniref:Calnexin n=1 Tax=Fraxinus pennsylvanica TaxID=56036 RepID=A0AAD2A2H2_9LAMI|nr:unnamed protein product [Fraxinus pennsylvanica]
MLAPSLSGDIFGEALSFIEDLWTVDITRIKLPDESICLKLLVLIFTGTKNERDICFRTSYFCWETKFNRKGYKYNKFAEDNSLTIVSGVPPTSSSSSVLFFVFLLLSSSLWPKEILDPEATKPEDWDDEEDGEWEAPKIDNPKCEKAPGCGEWKRPMKRNPAYKGKWHAPLVENPNYKGIWKPRLIGNPEYIEFEKPNFESIVAIGIEIWTMQDDGLQGVQKLVFDCLYKIADLPFLGDHKTKVLDILEKVEKQPNLTIGIVASIVVIFTVLLKVIFGGKKKHAKVRSETNKTDTAETSNNQGTTEEKEDKKEDTDAVARRRNTRHDS